MRRRRRRPASDSGRLVEDAFDLFLDALANAFGVIMFIALMIVIFAPMPREPSHRAGAASTEPTAAMRIAALLREAATLDEELSKLPPAGDPALVERLKALDRAMAESREQLGALLGALAARSDELRTAQREVQQHRTVARDLDARRAGVERRRVELAETTSFVRVSRFRDDPREAILLLVSEGGVERVTPAPGQTRILPGTAPRHPLRSADDARAAADALLRNATPARQRIEVGVWSDAFADYKRLERLLVERGFDLNPLPLRRGEALEAGSGGIQ